MSQVQPICQYVVVLHRDVHLQQNFVIQNRPPLRCNQKVAKFVVGFILIDGMATRRWIYKIGRASCRERVKIGKGEEKNKKQNRRRQQERIKEGTNKTK